MWKPANWWRSIASRHMRVPLVTEHSGNKIASAPLPITGEKRFNNCLPTAQLIQTTHRIFIFIWAFTHTHAHERHSHAQLLNVVVRLLFIHKTRVAFNRSRRLRHIHTLHSRTLAHRQRERTHTHTHTKQHTRINGDLAYGETPPLASAMMINWTGMCAYSHARAREEARTFSRYTHVQINLLLLYSVCVCPIRSRASVAVHSSPGQFVRSDKFGPAGPAPST